MSMASLQLYKNRWTYPDYGSITAVGSSVPCTPNGIGFKTGTITVASRISDFNDCNYIGITRNGKTIYAWIDDVVYATANSFEIHYSVDAWRTYRSNITLGTQFIERSPTVTDKYDDLLGGSSNTPIVETREFSSTPHQRVLIVQTRIVDGARLGYSSTPVQPSPYAFWAVPYNPNNWQSTGAITRLIGLIGEVGETNVVTMYSIPYMSTTELPAVDMPVVWGEGEDNEDHIPGWKLISNTSNVHENLTRKIAIPITWLDNDEFYRTEHSVKIVVPDAGIIDVPDHLIKKGALRLRQDVDLFSGASNYMLEDMDGNVYSQSVRGSSVSSIPVLSDAMDTYLSQNQNALTTSLIGDVASTGLGLVSSFSGGAMFGLPVAVSGINSIVSRGANIKDLANMNNVGNPPAFLGTALNGAYNGTFWIIATKNNIDNETLVHSNYGYIMQKVASLNFPSSGYIKTQGCNVSSDGTVPAWAIEEINSMFNNGVLVQ